MERLYRIKLLGSFCVRNSDERILHFGANKPGALLGYLAYYPHQAHLREVLLAQLWPEAEEQQGRESLSAALSTLRRQFKAMGVPAEEILLTDNSTVQIDPALVSTDVEEFTAHLEEAAQAETPRDRAHCLEQALALYKGSLLPGFYEDWIEPEQRQLEEKAYEAARRLTACLVDMSELDRALDVARRVVAMDPLHEEAHLNVMQVYAALGRPSAALKQYETLKRRLQREGLGPPGPEIKEFARRMRSLSASASAETKRRPSLSLPDSPPAMLTGTLMMLTMATPPPLRATEAEQNDRVLLGPQDWQAILEQEIAQNRGVLVHSVEQEAIALFRTAIEAFACASACENQWFYQALMAGVELSASPCRMALTVRTISRSADLYRTRLLHSVVGLLQATPPGCLLCSEAIAALLRQEIPFGSSLQEVGVYQLPGCAERERMFVYGFGSRRLIDLSLDIPPDTRKQREG